MFFQAMWYFGIHLRKNFLNYCSPFITSFHMEVVAQLVSIYHTGKRFSFDFSECGITVPLDGFYSDFWTAKEIYHIFSFFCHLIFPVFEKFKNLLVENFISHEYENISILLLFIPLSQCLSDPSSLPTHPNVCFLLYYVIAIKIIILSHFSGNFRVSIYFNSNNC